MGNDNIEPLRPAPSTTAPRDEQSPAPTEKSSRRPLFGSLNRDLKQALDTWEELTEQMNQRMSPEEEQMREVKRLLGELKSKLSQFED